MKFYRILFLLVLPLYFFSCKTIERTGNYLENVTTDTTQAEIDIPDLKIQKNDLLSIKIYSLSTKTEIDELYNQGSGNIANITSDPTAGYLVDNKGMIEHPRLGVFHAEGLTKSELAEEFKKRLTEPVELLRDPTVIIRFLNFKVIVLGEVTKPGPITVTGEKITILEAIGLAGDFSAYGKKKTVRVVREIDGKREIGIIDLSSKEVFDSPYYHLKQNDVVFVEPVRQKEKQAEQTVVAQRLTFALSLITAAAFIYNIFK